MSDFPLQGGSFVLVDQFGQDRSLTEATNIPADSTSDTKGLWVELISSTSGNSQFISLEIGGPNNENEQQDYFVDIGVGGLGSEEILIPNLFWSRQFENQEGMSVRQVDIPIEISEGTRISARCQGSSGDGQVQVNARTYSSSFKGPIGLSTVTEYGADILDTSGVPIDPGGSTNTQGNWIEITSSTTEDINYLMMMLGSNGNNTMSNGFYFLFDIATGGMGSEEIFLDGARVFTMDKEQILPGIITLPNVFIPSGTRLSVRSQCNKNDATDRVLDVVIYGVS